MGKNNQAAKAKREKTRSNRVGRPKKKQAGKASPRNTNRATKQGETVKRRRGRPPKNRPEQVLKEDPSDQQNSEQGVRTYAHEVEMINSEKIKLRIGQVDGGGSGGRGDQGKKEVTLESVGSDFRREQPVDLNLVRERSLRRKRKLVGGFGANAVNSSLENISGTRVGLVGGGREREIQSYPYINGQEPGDLEGLTPKYQNQIRLETQTRNMEIPRSSMGKSGFRSRNREIDPDFTVEDHGNRQNVSTGDSGMLGYFQIMERSFQGSLLKMEKRIERKMDCIGLAIMSLVKKFAAVDHKPVLDEVIHGALSYESVESFLKLMQTRPNLFRKKRRNSTHPERDSISALSMKGSVVGVGSLKQTPGKEGNNVPLKAKRGRPKNSRNSKKAKVEEPGGSRSKRRASAIDPNLAGKTSPPLTFGLESNLRNLKMVESQNLDSWRGRKGSYHKDDKLNKGKADIRRNFRRVLTMPIVESQPTAIEEETSSQQIFKPEDHHLANTDLSGQVPADTLWDKVQKESRVEKTTDRTGLASKNQNLINFGNLVYSNSKRSVGNLEDKSRQSKNKGNQSNRRTGKQKVSAKQLIKGNSELSFKGNSAEKEPGKKVRKNKRIQKKERGRGRPLRKRKNLNISETVRRNKNQSSIDADPDVLSMAQPHSTGLDKAFQSETLISFMKGSLQDPEHQSVDPTPSLPRASRNEETDLQDQELNDDAEKSQKQDTISKNMDSMDFMEEIGFEKKVKSQNLIEEQEEEEHEEEDQILPKSFSQMIKKRRSERALKSSKEQKSFQELAEGTVKKGGMGKLSRQEIGTELKGKKRGKKESDKGLEGAGPENIFANEEMSYQEQPVKKRSRGRPPKKRLVIAEPEPEPEPEIAPEPIQEQLMIEETEPVKPQSPIKEIDSKPNKKESPSQQQPQKISSRFSEEKLTAVKIILPIGTTPPQSNPASTRIKNISSIDNQMSIFHFGTPNNNQSSGQNQVSGSGGTDESNPREVLSFNRKGPTIRAGDGGLLTKPKQAVFVFENEVAAPGPTFNNFESHTELEKPEPIRQEEQIEPIRWKVEPVRELEEGNENSVEFLSKDELFKKNRPAPIIDGKLDLNSIGRETRPLSEIDSQGPKMEDDIDNDELDFMENFGF